MLESAFMDVYVYVHVLREKERDSWKHINSYVP